MARPPGISRVAGDAASILVLRVLQAGVAFITSAIVSRGLGPEGRGLYFTPLLVATTIVAFSHLGIDQVNVYLFGSRRIAWSRLVAQAGLVSFTAGSAGAVALLLFAAAAPGFFEGVPRSVVLLAALTVPFGVQAILGTGLLTLRGNVRLPLLVAVAGALLLLAVLGLLAWLGRFTPVTVFAATAVSNIVVAVAISFTLGAPRGLAAWDRGLLAESLAQSFVLHIGMVLLFLHLRVDMFLVKYFAGTAALGFYSLAVVLAETVMLVTDSLSTALVPRQMSGSLSDAAATALTGARTVVLIGLVISALWALMGLLVIRVVFGSAFEPVYVPLLVLLPGIVMLAMQRLCGPTVLRTGRPWMITGLQAAGFILNLLLNLWWIPLFGLVGAALASAISYAVGALGFLVWTSHLAGQPLSAVIPGVDDVRRLRTVLGALRPQRFVSGGSGDHV